MPKYILAYHGGSIPETKEEGDRVMADWVKWMGDVGPAMADGGNPTGASRTIAANGTVSDGGGSNPLSGFSIVEAPNLDAAVQLARGCPQLAAGGSIEVGELIDMG